jgi:hypothetical protein
MEHLALLYCLCPESWILQGSAPSLNLNDTVFICTVYKFHFIASKYVQVLMRTPNGRSLIQMFPGSHLSDLPTRKCFCAWPGQRLSAFGFFRFRYLFPEFNIRLYDKNSESDYFFFPPPKSEYFFQQHWAQMTQGKNNTQHRKHNTTQKTKRWAPRTPPKNQKLDSRTAPDFYFCQLSYALNIRMIIKNITTY